MCIRCPAPFSRPFASTVTVAMSPLSATVALPLPVTWLVGTAPRLVEIPGFGAAAVFLVVLELEPTTAATTPATTSSATPARIQARLPRQPLGFCGGGALGGG